MSSIYNRDKELQKKREEGGEFQDSKDREGVDEKAGSMKKRGSLRRRIFQKIRAKAEKREIGDQRIQDMQKKPHENSTAGVKKNGVTMHKGLEALLNEIREIRDIQKKLAKENESNKTQLDSAKKVTDEYSRKIKQLGEENKRSNEYKEKCDTLKAELEKKGNIIDETDAAVKASSKASSEAHALKLEKEGLEQKIANLEQELAEEKKKAKKMKDLKSQRIGIAAKKMPDSEMYEKIIELQAEVNKRQEAIENLVSQKKLNPEQERLMITWLNSALEEERKKNANLRKRLNQYEKK